MSYVHNKWIICLFLSQYVDDSNGWKLFFNSRGRPLKHLKKVCFLQKRPRDDLLLGNGIHMDLNQKKSRSYSST